MLMDERKKAFLFSSKYFSSPKTKQQDVLYNKLARFLHKFFLPVSRCIYKKCSFVIAVYIWSYGKHLTYDQNAVECLLCGYWSIFSAESFWPVSRRLGDQFSFCLCDYLSKLHMIYSLIDSSSGLTFFLKVIHSF